MTPTLFTTPIPQNIPDAPNTPIDPPPSPHKTPHPPPRQVYILSRMGNSRRALAIIIEQRRDIPRALEFVRRQCDDDLWGELIGWALRGPETTGAEWGVGGDPFGGALGEGLRRVGAVAGGGCQIGTWTRVDA